MGPKKTPSRAKIGTPGVVALVLCLSALAIGQEKQAEKKPGLRLAPMPAIIQQQLPGNQPRVFQRRVDPRGVPVTFTLARDQDAESWLKKARTAAEREDWKLALDTLWRVQTQYAYSIVHLEEGRPMSASEATWNLLRAWPAEALNTYRTIYEPEASRLLSEARQRHDVDGVRYVARSYLLTPSGAEALSVLATWAMDDGRFDEAAAALRRLARLPDTAARRENLLLRRAVAEGMSGRRQLAESLLEKATRSAGAVAGELRDGTEDKSDVLERRVAAVRRFLEGIEPDGSGFMSAGAAWPALLGGGDRRGLMAEVSPSIDLPPLWRMRLPGANGIRGEDMFAAYTEQGLGPSWQIVTDGRRLYVRTPAGVVAIDAATFEEVWQGQTRLMARRQARGNVRRIFPLNDTRGSEMPPGGFLDPATAKALSDELSGVVGVEQGMVFALAEPEDVDQGSAVMFQLGGGPWGGVDPFGAGLIENSLYAFDAETGKLLWQKGAGGPAEDGLSEVRFFSPPVSCGEGLVVPFALGDDFGLLVLRRNGEIVRRVVLGNAPAGAYPRRAVLWPTVSGTMMYVPTGVGALLALNVDDLSLRWVASYAIDQEISGYPAVFSQDDGTTVVSAASVVPAGWASNPPIVTDSLVLLAPPDSTRLIAFDRETGEIRWESARDAHRYLIGCDQEHVYLSGRMVRAARLTDGRRAWVWNDAKLTGRACLSGDRVLAPTVSGLVTLDARTGRVLSEPLEGQLAGSPGVGSVTTSAETRFATGRSFGNLLAWNDSLYHVTAESIERVPDVDRSLSRAESEIRDRPNDRGVLFRLAQLHWLKDELEETVSLLERARRAPASDENDFEDRLTDLIDHLWIEGQLRLASEASGVDRLSRLLLASEAARRMNDIVRIELALMHHEVEQGEADAAFNRGLALIRDYGRETLQLDSELVGPVWVAVSERLERLWLSADAQGQAAYQSRLDSMLSESSNAEELGYWSDAFGFCASSALLDLQLGRHYASVGALETAEFYLRRALSRASPRQPEAAAEALARLVMLHLEPGEGLPTRPDLAGHELMRLRNNFHDAWIRLEGSRPTGVAAFVSEWERRLPGRDVDAYRMQLRDFSRLDEWRVLEYRTDTTGSSPVLLRTTEGGTPQPAEMAILGISQQIVALDVGSDLPRSRHWTCTPETHPAGMSVRPSGQRSQIRGERIDPAPPPGAVWGTTAMAPYGNGYHMVGIITGRLLGPPLISESFLPARSSGERSSVVVADGCFVMALDSRTLVAVPARENTGPLWTREFSDLSIHALYAVDDHVAVLDNRRGEIVVVRPWSGRIQARVRYAGQMTSLTASGSPSAAQTADASGVHGLVGPVVVGSLVCAAQGAQLRASHAASGRVIWQTTLAEEPADLRRLGSRHLGVTYGSSRFGVVDTADGSEVFRLTPEHPWLPPSAAAVHEGLLILLLRSPTVSTGPLRGGGDSASFLAAYDLLSGSKIWSYGPLDNVLLNEAILNDDSSILPIVETIGLEPSPQTVQRRGNVPGAITAIGLRATQTRVILLDKATGSRLGKPIKLEAGSGMTGAVDTFEDVRMFERRLLLLGRNGYYVIGEPVAGSVPEVDFDDEEHDIP
jgi:outer membrane protein assembly factor BamB/tetratricopeptide (TPR) repeat protein